MQQDFHLIGTQLQLVYRGLSPKLHTLAIEWRKLAIYMEFAFACLSLSLPLSLYVHADLTIDVARCRDGESVAKVP